MLPCVSLPTPSSRPLPSPLSTDALTRFLLGTSSCRSFPRCDLRPIQRGVLVSSFTGESATLPLYIGRPSDCGVA